MIPLVLASLATLVLGIAAASERRLAHLEVELEGPLEGLAVELEPFGRAELTLSMRAGERRRVLVPLAAPLEGSPPQPRLAPRGAGRAQALGWSKGEEPRVPAALAARPLPPVEPEAPRARPLAWPLLALAVLGAWSLRRRATLALGAGIAGALALAALGARAGSSGCVRVLDGDGGLASAGTGARWISTDGAPKRLPLGLLDAQAGARLSVRPEGRALVARATVGGAPEPAWSLEGGPGSSLWARAPADVGERGFRMTAGAERGASTLFNEWGSVEAVWWRSALGEWRAGGAWERGEPLTSALARLDEGPAPGWLAAGLPPGVEVLLARLGLGEAAGDRAPTWIRLTRPGGGP